MIDSKPRAAARKPARTIRSQRKAKLGLPPEFPLFPHANGRWAKKIRGKFQYFGKVTDDPKGEAAIRLWLDQKDDLLAGRTPRAGREGITVGELCDRFIQAKDQQLDAGEITARTRADYYVTSERVVSHFGKTRLVADLASDDFESLRASIAKTRGPVALGNEIQKTRVLFKYAHDAGLIDQPVRYGPMFKRPSKKVLRIARAEKGAKLIEAADLRKLIKAADVHMKAMIYLGLNCGFGNADCGTLPLTALDLDGGWINYHRPKTGIDRRCPLWPETVKALRESIDERRKPKTEAASGTVFVTRCGDAWAKDNSQNPVTGEFRKLLDEAGLHRPGLGFYTLRHVFRTVADDSRDQVATNAIMGHADGSMAAAYRERISDERLRAVADHVRNWLLAKPETAPAPSAGDGKRAAKKRNVRTADARRASGSRQAQAAVETEGFQFRIVG